MGYAEEKFAQKILTVRKEFASLALKLCVGSAARNSQSDTAKSADALCAEIALWSADPLCSAWSAQPRSEALQPT